MKPNYWWIYIAGLCICLGVGFAVGAGSVTALKNAEIAKIQRDQATAERQTATANLGRLAAAQARGDAITTDLLAAKAEADAYQEQLHASLSRETTGRACLGTSALRLLDRSAGLRADLPAPTRSAVAADAGDLATDTQVARWAADAYHQYAECARRLDALIQFSEEAP